MLIIMDSSYVLPKRKGERGLLVEWGEFSSAEEDVSEEESGTQLMVHLRMATHAL